VIPKPIGEITADDLHRLRETEVAEGKTLEYKRIFPDPLDGGNLKILRSITSFANSDGGDLLYGVDAPDSVPTGFPGIPAEDIGAIRERLDNLCRDGVSPRLPHPESQFVDLGEGRTVLVIRMRRSWTAPHRVTTGGHAHFYGRNASGSYQLDVADLRSAFLSGATVIEQMRTFQQQRHALLLRNGAPADMERGPRLVMHLLPLSAFATNQPIDIRTAARELRLPLPIGMNQIFNRMVNLDGVFTTTGLAQTRAYALLFRTGAIESVAVMTQGDEEARAYVHAMRLSPMLPAMTQYLGLYRHLGVGTPVYLFVSLLGVTGHALRVPDQQLFDDEPRPIDRDNLILPEIEISDLNAPATEICQPAFDLIWNAFGYERSPEFLQNGNWVRSIPL